MDDDVSTYWSPVRLDTWSSAGAEGPSSIKWVFRQPVQAVELPLHTVEIALKSVGVSGEWWAGERVQDPDVWSWAAASCRTAGELPLDEMRSHSTACAPT